jgi:hypothetical protein
MAKTTTSSNRSLKTVITLKSGKSIVNTGFEDECFKIYNQWIKYKAPKTEDGAADKIIIEKKKNNLIVEVIAVLTSEVVSMQITDDANFKG